MAGDWIKMGVGLRSHPKVVRIASALKADKLRVVGGLHAVWCVFDQHSADGVLDGYTLEAMDAEIGWPGFSVAMAAPAVGWLLVGEDCLSVPRFDTHNGASAKRRALDAERKRDERGSGEKTGKSKKAPKDVRDPSASDADKTPTREEKEEEREERDDDANAKAPATADQWPAEFTPKTWEQWRKWYEAKHGVVFDPYSPNDREKFRPLAQAWVNAKVTVGQMDRAIEKAHKVSTEPIVSLAHYANRVLDTVCLPAKAADAARPRPHHAMAPEDRKAVEDAEIAKAMQRRAARNGGGNVIDMEVVNG